MARVLRPVSPCPWSHVPECRLHVRVTTLGCSEQSLTSPPATSWRSFPTSFLSDAPRPVTHLPPTSPGSTGR